MKRLFHFQDGKSNKFWEIERSGYSFTVRFGKIGTNGQTQTKEFADAEKTEKEYNKLVAEKLKKGYIEQGGTAPTASTSAAPPPTTPKKTKPAAKPKAKATVESETAPAPEPEIARKLNLRPEDWFWATWRELEPLKPKTEKYDYPKLIEKLTKAKKNITNWYDNIDDLFRGNRPFSGAESLFWIDSMMTQKDAQKINCAEKGEVEFLAKEELKKRYSFLDSHFGREKDLIFRFLRPLAAPVDLLDLILDRKPNVLYSSETDETYTTSANGFGLHVLPYLETETRKQLRERMRERLESVLKNPKMQKDISLHYRFAAVLGLHDEIEKLVARFPGGGTPNTDPPPFQPATIFLFGLGSHKKLQQEWRRLDLRLWDELDVRKWLAHTEVSALDEVAASIALLRKNYYSETRNMQEMTKFFTKTVFVPEAAAPMLRIKMHQEGGNPNGWGPADRRSQGTSPAEDWLVKNPELAIAGLLETATRDSELGKEALAFLKIKLREGFKETIEKYLSQQKPEVVTFLRENLFAAEADAPAALDETKLPKSVQKALAETKTKGVTPPLWASFAAMPPILIDGAAVNGNLYEKLIGAIDKGKFEQPAPLILAVRESADKKSLEDWSFALFDAWVKEAFPPDAKWALKSLGYFGGDRAAFHLVPYIRAWPSDGGYARSVLALDCLRAIGSDVALMQLNGIAQKCTTKGLKKHAAKLMEEIAAEKQLTRSQLEDRIVPDCDLDERGQKTFDFGPRRFYFALGPDMKPKIKDEDGKLRDDLPKPSQKDDTKKADAAVAEWKAMKKTLRDLVKVQSLRLEQAMVTQRSWTPEEFETLLVRHPLMTHLVRLLVWGVFEQKGKLVSTFRVTDEQDFADVKDDAFTLPKDGEIRLVHPLDLDASLKTKWGEVFDDYRVVPPFPQLGRETFGLEKGEKTKLERWKKVKINGATLSGALERLGWDRGYPGSGYMTDHSKQFPGAGVTAIVEYEPGIPIYDLSDSEEQTIHFVRFIPGLHHVGIINDEVIAAYKKDVLLEKVDRIAVSEVINDLNQVAAKGNEA